MTKPRVNFFTEEITYRLQHKRILKNWFLAVITLEKGIAGEINCILCSDDYLYKLNNQYLKHKTLTDVITFDYGEEASGKHLVQGDIFISLERVRENAVLYSVSALTEMRRVMVHGLLHLLGYDDHTAALRQQMRDKEDFYLLLLEQE